jgi:catechol 2,3-dioxygenase-like lactoylglutathione lyase family enzyme
MAAGAVEFSLKSRSAEFFGEPDQKALGPADVAEPIRIFFRSQNAAVEVTHTFGGVAVTDFAAAYQWFVRLFGRAADMFPHDGEAVWRLTTSASVYVVHDAERAGHSLLTLAVGDLDACASHLRENGFAYSEHSDGGAPLRLLVKDDDGNTIALFQDPARPPD